MMADVFSPIYLGLPGLALLLFWSPVSRAEESAPPAAGPSPTSIASEAGPSPSPTATPPRTAGGLQRGPWSERAIFRCILRPRPNVSGTQAIQQGRRGFYGGNRAETRFR